VGVLFSMLIALAVIARIVLSDGDDDDDDDDDDDNVLNCMQTTRRQLLCHQSLVQSF